MIIAPFLCDLRIDEDGGMKIQMMSFPCRGIPRQGKEVMNHQIISHQRLCNPHCLRLYLMVLGLLALWEGRSEVLLEGILVVSWEKILLSIFQIL